MSFRDAAKAATRNIISALGEPFYYRSIDGYTASISGSFESEYLEQDTIAGMVSVMSVNTADGCFKQGDIFVVDDIDYVVVVPESDSDGMTRCILEKSSG